MPDETAPFDAQASEGVDFARPVLERQAARLEELAEIGMEIARDLRRRVAEAAAPGVEAVDPSVVALAFGRVSRAVRMTCALQTEVLDKLRGVGRIEAYDATLAAQAARKLAEAAARSAAALDVGKQRLLARKSEIAKAMTGVIGGLHRGAEGGEAHERCIREATERLKDANDLGDILSRPISEIIEQICRDLGLSPDWERLAMEPWALTERWSGKVGAPLKSPSPWIGTAQRGEANGSRVGVDTCPAGAAPDECISTPVNASSPRAEPLPPPIPTLSPIQGERHKADADALRGYPVGLPGELPPDRGRRRRPDPPQFNFTRVFL